MIVRFQLFALELRQTKPNGNNQKNDNCKDVRPHFLKIKLHSMLFSETKINLITTNENKYLKNFAFVAG